MTGIKTLPVQVDGSGGGGLAGEALMELSFAWASKMVRLSLEATVRAISSC